MWQASFLVVFELGFVIYQYGFKSELLDKFRCKPPYETVTLLMDYVGRSRYDFMYNKSSFIMDQYARKFK
jgi:hypothetical protein